MTRKLPQILIPLLLLPALLLSAGSSSKSMIKEGVDLDSYDYFCVEALYY